MNRSLSLIITASILAFLNFSHSLFAAPLVSIGDNADIYFNGSTSLRYDSNVFRNEDGEEEDLIWTISPGFEFDLGRGLSNADFSIITRYDIRRYDDLDGLDTELFSIEAAGSYTGTRLDLSASASFEEEKAATGDLQIQDLVESDRTSAKIDVEYELSPKLSFGTGIAYAKKDYKTFQEFFADRESYTLPFDIFYELTPKLDLILGYQYRLDKVDGTEGRITDQFQLMGQNVVETLDTSSYDADNHFFNVGLRGDLLPKLVGSFRAGYRLRDSDDRTLQATTIIDGVVQPLPPTGTLDGRSNGSLGIDADLTWLTSPKLTTSVGLSRDFGIGSAGESTERTGFDLILNYAINPNFSTVALASYSYVDFRSGREDDTYRAGLRLNYVPNEYWSFGTGYNLSDTDSNTVGRSNTSHILDISASLRY
ncbi:MAG: outer membrane beta-barrel protein [Verrucomicrobiota bacterium]